MGIGVSLVLIAIGAILAIAVDYQAQGVSIQAVGVILMVVGFVGLLISLLFWSSFFGTRTTTTTTHGHTTDPRVDGPHDL